MKEFISTTIRKIVSPSMRYEIKDFASRLRENLSRVCLWNWEVAKLTTLATGSHEIVYLGRKVQQDMAKAILNLSAFKGDVRTEGQAVKRKVIISELPFPGCLRVPVLLSSVVPLGRPIEEIISNYHRQLRQDLQKNRSRYRLRQLLDSEELKRADREMLRPYAIARHGAGAAQIVLDDVIKLAQKYGRLDQLLMGDDIVGCQLGHEIMRAGKRYWSTNRCGYPEAIFTDPKRLRDCNAMNIFLALEWANENGFDYYDIGVSLGRPGDGLLEWKRRRGAELNTMGNSGCFYIRLPKVGAAQFLWDSPLFAIEHQKLTLHLGLPDGRSDDDATSHYREMAFGGLFKVYLHCAIPPSEQLLETLRGYYAQQKFPPIVETISTN